MHDIHSHIEGKSHVIWDWNGTLLADIDHAVATVNQLLVEEGLPPTTVDQYKKMFGFPVIDYYRKLGFQVSMERFKEISERFQQIFHDGLDQCELWPGVRDVLSEIKKSGRRQSVLSASEHNLLQWSLKKFDVFHLFDHVMGIADKMATSKVEFGHKLMDLAKIPAEQTVLIGDTDHDLEVAKALGIDMILVEHGHQCPTRLRDIHHTVVKVI